jgi:hypothetical protein
VTLSIRGFLSSSQTLQSYFAHRHLKLPYCETCLPIYWTIFNRPFYFLRCPCVNVVPGEPLTDTQKFALDLVARLHGGRDVVLAIDLTESVGLNNEGQLRIKQIIEDSLKPGDTVYIVPFATSLNPRNPSLNPLLPENSIQFRGQEDIETILQAVPRTDLTIRQTDIQQAELSIYQNLAQLNQCRLLESEAIKPQSVVWITDAPLHTKPGSDWIETPFDSPFRNPSSFESQQRQAWLEKLPRIERPLSIQTTQGKPYNLTVVDIRPTVQEFCTPAPGGHYTCLVTPYLLRQLWLPGTVLILVLVLLLLAIQKWIRRQKKWRLIVDFNSNIDERKTFALANNGSIEIGRSGIDAIDCPGVDVRARLQRKGERLYLIPTKLASIYYNSNEVNDKQQITSDRFRLNCPNGNKDFEIKVQIKK